MKLTITLRFTALSTLVVAAIFALFNAFVYLEFMNVTIENEKQVVLARLFEVTHLVEDTTEQAAVAAVRRVVPDPHQMVRLLAPNGQVLTSSDVAFLPSWIPQGLGRRTALGRGVTLFERGDQRILIASARVHARGGWVTVQWLDNVESLDHSIAFVFYLLMTGSIGGLVLAAVASYFLARYSLLPIREMIATAGSITPGDLSSRIDVPKRQDELTELGHTFNAMLDRISFAFSRERQFIADASHELRTPLSVLDGYVRLLRRWGWQNEEVRAEAVQAIEDEVRHLRAMANQLLTLTAVDGDADVASGVTDIAATVRKVVGKWQALYASRQFVSQIAEGVDVTVHISELRFEQLLRALLDNAIKYTPERGEIAVTVHREQDTVQMLVRDTGPGIPPEDLPFVTERFYRADKARSRVEGGTGLGLAICREIAERAGGGLLVRSFPGRGAEVEVTFPAARGKGEGEA